MGRQKSNAKLQREVRRNSRNSQKGVKNGFGDNFGPVDNIDMIGMAKEKRDNSPLEPRTVNQELYLNNLQTKPLVFATGEAGSGKTFLAAAYAAERLIAKDYDKIIVTRPVLSAEEDLGFLPGDISEKFAPFFRPVYDVLRKRLGATFLEYCLRPAIEKVEIAPFSYMRGRTFEKAVVILDEAQNVTKSQMKLFLTRIGEDCLCIINGDVTQCDLPKGVVSGLGDAMTRFSETEMVGITHFEKADSVRSLICSLALDVYE